MENINNFEELFNQYLPQTPLPMEECFPTQSSPSLSPPLYIDESCPTQSSPPSPPPPPPPLSPPSEHDDIVPTDYLEVCMDQSPSSPITTTQQQHVHFKIENVKRVRYSSCNFKGCCKVYKGGSSFRSLYRHQKRTHEGNSYVCHFCEKDFQSSDALSFHQSAMCESPEKVYKCHPCNKSYTDLHAFNFHNQKHEAHVCPECKIVCQTQSSLKNHSRIHNTNLGRYYTCNICSAQYILEANLKKHQFKLHFLPFCNTAFETSK